MSSEMALGLRNSLTTIAGYAQQLAASRDAELARQLAADIAAEAAHLDRTIGGFLAGATSCEGRFESLSLTTSNAAFGLIEAAGLKETEHPYEAHRICFSGRNRSGGHAGHGGRRTKRSLWATMPVPSARMRSRHRPRSTTTTICPLPTTSASWEMPRTSTGPEDANPAPDANAAKPEDGAATPESKDAKKDDAADAQKVNDQWKQKIADQQGKIDLLSRELDVTQREYRLRAAAFYADAGNRLRGSATWDKEDAQYKQQIAQKQKAVDDAKKALDDLKEQARKAGVPAKLRE